MRAIAAASGCTTGALYPLFPSKEAIYAELLAESLLRLRDSVNASIQGVLDPRTRLTAGARAFLSYYRTARTKWRSDSPVPPYGNGRRARWQAR